MSKVYKHFNPFAVNYWTTSNFSKVAIIGGTVDWTFALSQGVPPIEVFDFSALLEGTGNVTRCDILPNLPGLNVWFTGCLFNNTVPLVCGGVNEFEHDCYYFSDQSFEWVGMINDPHLDGNNGVQCLNFGLEGRLA